MYVEELTLMLAVDIDGRELLFSFDSGASSGSLTAKYFHQFSRQFSALKMLAPFATKLGLGFDQVKQANACVDVPTHR